MDAPSGPLTLRVYVGEACKGTLYQDDGVSYEFKQGEFLRMDSTCSVDHTGLHVQVGSHQGSYRAWWSQITIEVHGWKASNVHAELAGKDVNLKWNSVSHAWQATVPDTGNGLELIFEQ
jgi:alpha-glucosidase